MYNRKKSEAICMDHEKIMIVDDDNEIRELLHTMLVNEGYDVIEADCGERALELVDDKVDLVVLDIMMPGMSGLKVCSKLREKYNMPILFLTAKGMDSDLTMGFSCGGDDYVVKPFSFSELLARIKGLLRRYKVYSGKKKQAANEVYEYKNIVINAQYNEVKKDGEDVNLSEIEYQMLKLMIKYRGKIFTMQNLYESVWNEPYLASSANTIMAHIRKLRVKLEDDPQKPQIIKTVWGKGYRVE